uniref:Myb/SANT-like domain-containing protein n=1 Tax=Fagus sylvatica TaxID=28930 RepID=A0A2N9GVW4_FAGSY
MFRRWFEKDGEIVRRRRGWIRRHGGAAAKSEDMGKKSKKDGGDPSKEVQWTSVMDDVLVDALLYQLSIGARVNGTFNSRAYDEVVKELVAKFDMDINKDKSKPAAKKWMATPIPNYFKMAQLWAKDRATGDHAETAKEKRARYATSTTIDGIDLMVSQNEVSLENFEVEESDQMRSPEINVVRQLRLWQKCFMKISGAEIYAALEVLDLEPTLVTDAYIFLMDNAKYKDMFFGCPVSGQGCSWWSLWGCGGLGSWVAGCGGFALAIAVRKWWLISRQIFGFLVDLSSDLWWLVEDMMGFCEIYVVCFVGFVMGCWRMWWFDEFVVGFVGFVVVGGGYGGFVVTGGGSLLGVVAGLL